MTHAKLFALGREVGLALPFHVGLRPSRLDFRAAAGKLGIKPSLARKAWMAFTWGPLP